MGSIAGLQSNLFSDFIGVEQILNIFSIKAIKSVRFKTRLKRRENKLELKAKRINNICLEF